MLEKWKDCGIYCVVEIRAWILEVACCEFSSKFTPLHLTVWTVCTIWEATPSILGKSPLFFLWCFGLSNFCVCYNQRAKGIKEKGLSWKECPSPLNKFPRNWFLEKMYFMSQTIGCIRLKRLNTVH